MPLRRPPAALLLLLLLLFPAGGGIVQAFPATSAAVGERADTIRNAVPDNGRTAACPDPRTAKRDTICRADTGVVPARNIELIHPVRPPVTDILRYGQEVDSMRLRIEDRNNRLYDSIARKMKSRTVSRFIYRTLFRHRTLDTTSSGRVIEESRLFEPYAGKRIGRITIVRDAVFRTDGNWFERTGNRIHVLTRERVIRRDLLFREGDPVDPEQLVRNMRLLRERSYLSDVGISAFVDPFDTTTVHLTVRTRDSWSISADGSLHGEGRTMVGVYDANILGSGNTLRINTHFNRNDFGYGGNIVSYEIPNILGSFFTADFSAGRDFYNSELRMAVRKEFIRPTDYEAGISYDNVKEKWYRSDLDTATLARIRSFELWGGRSRQIAPIRSSLFFTGHYRRARFGLRPEVAPRLNPLFHDRDELLLGVGLYRERFYTANLVYGYGTREFLATGYNASLVGGYTWNEFERLLYLGPALRAGGFLPVGYVMGGFTLGSYIDPRTGAWRRSAVDVDARWISNLFIAQRSRIRQFLSLNYTQGWNRYAGSNETIRFTDENGIRTLRENSAGRTRAILNTETVLFTPYQPLGFRIALFGFADFGLLGDDPNPFRNEFFASFGIGVRLRNERLIFSAVQFELGFSFGKRGWLDSRYANVSNQRRFEEWRYIPSRPEALAFE